MGFTDIGNIIRQKREAKKWTQEQLAAKARITSKYVSRIETGVQQPSLPTLQKIAKAFDSELQIDIPLEQKTEQQQALDELLSTVKDKSADYINKITKAIQAIES